jgi:hypothetical protein
MAGTPNASLVAAAAKVHLNLRTGMSISAYRSTKELSREIVDFEDLLDTRTEANKAARAFHQSNGLFAAIHCIASRNHTSAKADEFFGLLHSPIGIANPHHPALALSKRLQANLGNKAKLPNIEVAALLIKAWNSFIAGKGVATLKWNGGGESPEGFPKVK